MTVAPAGVFGTSSALIGLFGDDALDPQQSGGKGSALCRLAAAGLPVPEGFIVTAEVFSRLLTQLDL